MIITQKLKDFLAFVLIIYVNFVIVSRSPEKNGNAGRSRGGTFTSGGRFSEIISANRVDFFGGTVL